jgi:hypothetical protein
MMIVAFIAAFILSLAFLSMLGLIIWVVIDDIIEVQHPLMITVIIVFLLAIAGGLIGGAGAGNEWTTTQPIASLNDDSAISGRFILGSGTIKENPVYVYYSVEPDGGMILHTLSASSTRIYEDSNEPYLKTNNKQMLFGNVINSYEFHVPNNTVMRYYELDSRL